MEQGPKLFPTKNKKNMFPLTIVAFLHLVVGDVLGGEGAHHAGHLQGLGEVQVLDDGVGPGRQHGDHEQLALDVGEVVSVPM